MNDTITQRDLINQSFDVIRQYEPTLNAMATSVSQEQETRLINLSQASEKYSDLSDKTLKGIPLVIKDVLQTSEFPTYGGNNKPYNDNDLPISPIIEKIESAGGFIIGKTNCPKDAMDYQTFSSRFRHTSNPYDINRTSGGSSGGSAVAVAKQYVDVAIGSDFGGSLRQPASFCGIYSLKPTFGQLETKGHIMVNEDEQNNHQLTIGPMANSLEDIEIMWEIMKKGTISIKNIQSENYDDDLNILLSTFWDHIETDHAISQLLKDKFRGIITEEINNIPLSELISKLHKEYHNNLMEQPSSFEEHQLEEFKLTVQQHYIDLLEPFDVWICPVVATLPFPHNFNHSTIKINQTEINYWKANGSYCLPFNVLGLPVVTIPLGQIRGLPVGIQIVGTKNKESDLIQHAKTIEELLKSNNS